MARQIINVGSAANDGTGDGLRTAYIKCNDNFQELYNTTLDPNSIVNGTSNVSVVAEDGNVAIAINGTSNIAVISAIGLEVTGNANTTGNVTAVGTITGNDLVATDQLTVTGTIASNLTPDGNGTRSLGTTNSRWSDLFLSGSTLTMGNLIFKNTTANTLDIFGADGTTPANLSNDVINAAEIYNGTSNVAVVSADGNITVGINGTSNVVVFSAGGIETSATANVNSGNVISTNALESASATVTGNVSAGDFDTDGNVSAGFYIGDGGLLSNITVVSNVAVSQISNGSSSLAVNGAGGNITITVAATGVATYNASNIQFSADLQQSANIDLTGNLLASDSIEFSPNVKVKGDAAGRVDIGYDVGTLTAGANAIAIGISTGANLQSEYGLAIGFNAGNESQGTRCVAIGDQAGELQQQANSVSVGTRAGTYLQGEGSVAYGEHAGGLSQGANSVSIGRNSGKNQQGISAIAIGDAAGFNGQGNNSVAIGFNAGYANLPANTTVINASTAALNPTTGEATYINPVRESNAGNLVMQYNATSKEITYSANIGNASTRLSGVFVSTIDASGNANVGNIDSSGIMSATANITGGNLITAGLASVTGNITGGNIISSGLLSATTTITATGNITGGNLITSGLASITGNITGGNLITAGLASVTGNLTAGNISTSGLSMTGNLSTGNISTGIIDATGNVNAGSLYTTGTADINLITANIGTFATAANITSNTAATSTTSGSLRTAGGLGVVGNIHAGGSLTINSSDGATAIVNGSSNAVGNIGSSTNYFNTFFGLSTSAQYADVAEYYDSDAEYTPGTVLDFGGQQEVTINTVESSAKVAGVVSSNPALIMNAGGTLDSEHSIALALTGRVPTNIIGPVNKGDMMIAAGNGRAMACSLPAIGTVIGKALEDFDGDLGVIEVVVGRL